MEVLILVIEQAPVLLDLARKQIPSRASSVVEHNFHYTNKEIQG